MTEVRPIDANALIGFLHNQEFIDGDDRSRVYRWIEEQPTIESEPMRHGRWIDIEDTLFYECSVCSNKNGYMTPYCPYCGARMDGGDN